MDKLNREGKDVFSDEENGTESSLAGQTRVWPARLYRERKDSETPDEREKRLSRRRQRCSSSTTGWV